MRIGDGEPQRGVSSARSGGARQSAGLPQRCGGAVVCGGQHDTNG